MEINGVESERCVEANEGTTYVALPGIEGVNKVTEDEGTPDPEARNIAL